MKFFFYLTKKSCSWIASRKTLELKYACIKGHVYQIAVDHTGTIKKAFLGGGECLPSYVAELNLYYSDHAYHSEYLFATAPQRRLV